MLRACLFTGLLLLCAGCASTFPPDLLRSIDRSIAVGALREDPAAYLGRRVMVGGDILVTRPKPGETEIELLSKPLSSDDRPRPGDVSNGRVLIRSRAFLDPAVYAEGRRLTAIGTVAGDEERKIGDLPYRYPVIEALDIELWPREVVEPYPAPWAYPPWPYPPWWRYRVYGPWSPWPYW